MENITYVGLESKHPHTTCCLVFNFKGKFPQDLELVLAGIGWQRDKFLPPPPLNGVEEVVFLKDGTAIFNEWTKSENTKNMREIKKVLNFFGLTPVRRKLTMTDCL
jgi:hypothetical protein